MKKVLLAVSVAALAHTAQAATLNLYCSAQEDWCQLMSKTFEEKTGINVKMQRKSSGETFAQIRAESANPKGDVWRCGRGTLRCLRRAIPTCCRELSRKCPTWAVTMSTKLSVHLVRYSLSRIPRHRSSQRVVRYLLPSRGGALA